jgi:hypothetical protein
MPEERDDEPKIRIVDRRMLSDEERQGTAPANEESAPPKLEIIGGGAPQGASQAEEESESDEDFPQLSPEEIEEMRAEMEAEQFAEIEQRMGRPLTEQEKDVVRNEMERQAQSAASLEVAPVLMQLLQELSARAAVHMGLMPNPYTRLIARNDVEARLAIDAFGAIVQVVKPQLEPQMAREFERVLNDLRVNFTSITGTQLPGNTPGFGGPGGFGGPRIIH